MHRSVMVGFLHHLHSKWVGIVERISLATAGFCHSHSAVFVGFAFLDADAALLNDSTFYSTSCKYCDFKDWNDHEAFLD